MGRTILAVVVTLVIMHVGAFVAYGAASALFGLDPPKDVSPAQLFASVFVQKLGLAVAFVLLYQVAHESWVGRWFTYALIWFTMFAIMECGQAMGPAYSWSDAAAGVVAEGIYCPLSALVLSKMLGTRASAQHV